MTKIFQFDNVTNKIELDVPEILLVKEFARLMDNERNICKEDPKGILKLRAFREFSYIWLAIDWKSIYSDYSEMERHNEAMRDSGLTEEEFNDPDFRAACRKYRKLQDDTRSIRLLQSALNLVEKFIDYFNNIDVEERDEQTGKPIWKVKDVMGEMDKLDSVLESLQALESRVRKEIAEASTIRAGAQEGFLPNF